MAKLILSMDGLVLKEIPLSKDRLTIGRKPHNDVQIDNLAISGEHVDHFVDAVTRVVHLAHTSTAFWGEALGMARRAVGI